MSPFPEEDVPGQEGMQRSLVSRGAGAAAPLRAASVSHGKGFPYSYTSRQEERKRRREEMSRRKWKEEKRLGSDSIQRWPCMSTGDFRATPRPTYANEGMR